MCLSLGRNKQIQRESAIVYCPDAFFYNFNKVNTESTYGDDKPTRCYRTNTNLPTSFSAETSDFRFN